MSEDDPYEANAFEVLRAKWINDSKMLYGDFKFAQGDSSLAKVNKQNLPDMVGFIKRNLLTDWSDINLPENRIYNVNLFEHYTKEINFENPAMMQNDLIDMVYATHPFDVVGYDGYNYPYAFSIHDFEPITGRIHQPPPVHQTFETAAFVVCSFVPRLYDYHPLSIPAPYNHSNIDSDEVIYYVDGDFMSRNDIAPGHISLHPAGIPHGPHPGATERSIGKTQTEELAVMVDTFKPLMVTEQGLAISDGNYYQSWLD